MNTKASTREDYINKINTVLEYINNHLDEEMNLKKLAAISNFSEYHFHRIFKAFRSETLASYITRIRIETAARLLRYSGMPVEAIAYNIGYETPSSLSKAFRQLYGITPTEYRTNKEIYIMKKEEVQPGLKLKAPKVLDLEAKQAIYIHLNGAYNGLDFDGAFTRLWSFVKEYKLFTAGIEHFSIYHDDPEITESSRLRTDVCLVIHKPAQPQGGIGIKEIQGGKYAVFNYTGPYHNLGAAYDYIFGEWLPDSGHQLRNNAPTLEKYLNNPQRVPPAKLKTEIYLPLK